MEFEWCFAAPPDRVFGVLVASIAKQGRIFGIEDRGASVVFSSGRGLTGLGPRIKAAVAPVAVGTVVHIGAHHEHYSAVSGRIDGAECERLNVLLALLDEALPAQQSAPARLSECATACVRVRVGA